MKNATTKFILIYLLAIIAMLFFAAKCSGQERKPTDSVLHRITIPSYTTFRYLPVYRDTIVIRDTVYIRDTVFVATNPQRELIWSKYTGSFQSFIDSAAKGGLVAYIDKSVTPVATVRIPSNITIEADTNAIVRNPHKLLFQLSAATGTQIFKGLRIVQDSGGTAFERITIGVAYLDSIVDTRVSGGQYSYNSSRGGTPNKMAITSIVNCVFVNDYINIAVFSQDGPYRALHLRNVQMSAKRSHNLYIHPSVSLRFDSAASISAGKLMQHQFSGTGNGHYGTGKYSIFNRVFTNGKAFEMTSLADSLPIRISNSILAPYTTWGVPPPYVHATATQFGNGGNGAFLSGLLDSCTGVAWSMAGHPLIIRNSRLQDVSFRFGGHATIINSHIQTLWGADRGQPFAIKLQNCKLGQIWDGKNGDGVIQFVNTPIPNNNLRPDVIK